MVKPVSKRPHTFFYKVDCEEAPSFFALPHGHYIPLYPSKKQHPFDRLCNGFVNIFVALRCVPPIMNHKTHADCFFAAVCSNSWFHYIFLMHCVFFHFDKHTLAASVHSCEAPCVPPTMIHTLPIPAPLCDALYMPSWKQYDDLQKNTLTAPTTHLCNAHTHLCEAPCVPPCI